MPSLDESVTADVKFAQVPHWVLELPLSDKAVRLYAILSRYADNSDGTSYPGRGTLARLMRCHRTSVDRAVQELIDAGCISKQVRFKEGKFTSSLYTVKRIPPSSTSEGSRTHATTPSRTSATTSSHPCDIELEPQNVEPEELPASSTRKQSDRTFETVAEVCGISLKGMTRTARGQLNKAAKELREVEATPELIRAKADAYRKQYPNITLTPTALIKHWSSFDVEAKQNRKSIWETYERPEWY